MKAQHPNVMTGYPPERDSQVTFANYTITPFNTWGFRNMDSVTRTAMLPRGGSLPVMEEALDATLNERVITDADGAGRSLDDLLQTHNADGFLMLRDGKIKYESYWNGYSEHQRHIWYSMTKSLVSTAFGILAEQHNLDLSASPAIYIPELEGSAFERTTLQDVLNHASALAFKENYVDRESEFLQYYAPALGLGFIPGAQDAQPADSEIFGIYDFLAKFIQPEDTWQPGQCFEYNSANADIIGWMIARISGKSLQDYLAEHIWSKLGTNHDAAIVVDRACMAVATGGMTSTLRDAALFGELIRNKGQSNGQQLVPTTWVEETLNLNADDRKRYTNNDLYVAEQWTHYKNMWWILDPETEEYAAVGIHGQVIYINRSTNTVIAQFSSQPTASQVGSVQFRSKLIAIRDIANNHGI
ncbi:MAG: serine hydrolase [Gammaproteobacteria bacterium]|jgi:hypothetical protein|nr:serine hydrolase [Gammaproteobacteria bacterium]MBT3867978.1 serine hydrolase [Gammaproteobacteria bacterium]MBT4381579.1 serine hydrolase [Gammaproteobacteria bacterium]MBT4619451.1 serine hydrolase [Gammaproteobacteria bacterium]MBT5197765.1 serine hydrolase [Gammaproteobacteria bacterium]